MAVELPLDSTRDYRVSVTLDGETFRLRFYWADRVEGWFFDTYDADEVLISAGKRIATNTIVARGFVQTIGGHLVSITTEEQDLSEPGELDLGDRISVHYLTFEEIA